MEDRLRRRQCSAFCFQSHSPHPYMKKKMEHHFLTREDTIQYYLMHAFFMRFSTPIQCALSFVQKKKLFLFRTLSVRTTTRGNILKRQ